MERVQKLLAAAGVASRRNAELLISDGRVTVNGVTAVLGTRADVERDIVAVDGQPISQPLHRTLLLHKPRGYVTTRHDPHAPDTVMSLLPAIPGLHPIGRLDKDSTGLLLLTNDGALTYALTHPRHEVEKVYEALVAGEPDDMALTRLRDGMLLEDGVTAPAGVRILTQHDGETLLELTLHQGKKRQVRRMCAVLGHPVRALRRVRVGQIALGDVPEGAWRDLTAEELNSLRGPTGS
jgi:23S rRNA pseudouridine2605 synthase